MIFSKRKKAADEAEALCKRLGWDLCPVNLVTALVRLGYLPRDTHADVPPAADPAWTDPDHRD